MTYEIIEGSDAAAPTGAIRDLIDSGQLPNAYKHVTYLTLFKKRAQKLRLCHPFCFLRDCCHVPMRISF